jgi:hypothetical protein
MFNFLSQLLIDVYPYVKELRLLKLSVYFTVSSNHSTRLEQFQNMISRLGMFGHHLAPFGTFWPKEISLPLP